MSEQRSSAEWASKRTLRGRRGLLLALGAVALVGGLIAAALVVHASRMEPSVDGPVIARGSGWPDDGTDDGFGGTLDFSDGCIRVGESLVVWPHGASWEPKEQVVVTKEGTRFRDGDAFNSGVGYLPGTQDEFLANDAVAKVVRDCKVSEVLVLVEEVFPGTP